MDKEEEKSGPEESDEEETEESETDSEEEEGARLKPVFVRSKDRLTIQEREKEEMKQRQVEREATRMKEERRRQVRKNINTLLVELQKKFLFVLDIENGGGRSEEIV